MTVSIREASVDDIPKMMNLVRHYQEASKVSEFMEYNPEASFMTLFNLVDMEFGNVWVAENDGIVGVLGGMITPSIFSGGYALGNILFFWVEPKGRKKGATSQLIEAFEKWCHDLGVMIITGQSLNLASDKMKDFYQSKGYEPAEMTFVKSLREAA